MFILNGHVSKNAFEFAVKKYYGFNFVKILYKLQSTSSFLKAHTRWGVSWFSETDHVITFYS